MHASTQMNVHNINGLKFIKEMGFKRVVLAREVPIETIKKMKEEVDIELEVFGNNPAIHLYEKMGFKVHYRDMILKI